MDYRKLRAWQKAHELALDVYRSRTAFPNEEKFGLTSQIRRASVSVPSNLAEGCGRSGHREVAHFIEIAIGSTNELEYQLLLADDLRMLDDGTYRRLGDQVEAVRQLLSGLLARVRRNLSRGSSGITRWGRERA